MTAAASVLAASRNMRSVMARVSATIAPRPTPGKMKALFAWPISWRTPSSVTASNGDPVATIARPWLQASTSAGVASEADVGFDSGSTIGRSAGPTRSTIASMTASVNVPATPVAPTRIVGRRSRTTSSSVGVTAPSTAGTASSRFVASRSVRPAWTRPCVSTSAIASSMAASDSPASAIAARSSRPMPIPAPPAPTTTIRASPSVRPVARSPDRTPARTTAAVPWMSSLNDGTRPW